MKCVVPGVNVKILAKAIHALAKIGDEMYVHPRQNALSFRTVNMASSAYADFTLYKTYFSYYVMDDSIDEDALKCKISMRSAMTVFKAPNLIDKQVETCHIKLKPNASEISFILKYKNGITKTHLLPILESHQIQAKYNKDGACNELTSQPRVLGDAVQNFQQNLIEITLEVSPHKIVLRNYVDDVSGMANTTRTQLALGIGEFDKFTIGTETTITFCMKELRAILNFAETIGIPISIHFETAGRPVVFVLKHQALEANLVLSTVNPDTDSQTETTLVDKPGNIARKKAVKNRSTRKSNKASSRIENKSVRNSKILDRTDPGIEHSRQSLDQQSESLFSTPNTRDLERKNIEEMENNYGRSTSVQRNSGKISESTPPSRSVSSERNRTSLSGRKLASTVFSSITKRKSYANDINGKANGEDQTETAEDTVPSSPPPPVKKARTIFQKCFHKTFDPRMLPGHDIILAEDSDEYCSD